MLDATITKPELVLASQSPRRRALLAALGLSFTVDIADIDETPQAGEIPADLVCRLGRAKALAVVGRHYGAIVLAADTVVALDGALLGKPADCDEAWAMLRALRGRTHQVYTAITVAGVGHIRSQLTVSDVTMRTYSDAEISGYIASGDPLDKAGAYAIQHPLFAPVAGWSGCYTSIMGLPLRVVADLLPGAGVAVTADVAAVCVGYGGRCCLQDQLES